MVVILGQQYSVGENHTVVLYTYINRHAEPPNTTNLRHSLKKNLNTPRPSEHPQVKGGNIKTFRWDHRLQKIQKKNYFVVLRKI